MKLSRCFAIAVVLALVVSIVGPALVGAQTPVTIRARKYHDLNMDGGWDTGEPRLQYWEMGVSYEGGAFDTKLTDSNGWAVWNNMAAGNYTIRETLQYGWANSQPGGSAPYQYNHYFDGTSGNDWTFMFGNYKLAAFRARKYNDLDADAKGPWAPVDPDLSEPPLSGWNMTIEEYGGGGFSDTKETDGSGWAVWYLEPGTYNITEELKPCWVNTQPGGSPPMYTRTLGEGEDWTHLFGNYELGTITVCKDSILDDSQVFEFISDIPGHTAFFLDDDGVGQNCTTTFTCLALGSYNITEGELSGWDVTAINITGDDDYTSGNTTTRNATVMVDPGEDIVITFENTKRGTITVCKDTIPDDPHSFNFTSEIPGGSSFSLYDDGGGSGNCTTFSNVLPGTYNITEDDPSPGWDLTGLALQEGPGGNSLLDINNRRAEVQLDPGESVNVTFTNQEWGTICIYKDVVSIHTETQEFDFTVSNSTGPMGGFTLDDDGVGDNYDCPGKLAPDTYNVTEFVPDGWDLTDITIVDPSANSSSDLGAAKASLDLSLNEAIACYFENTKRGTIIVEKETRGGPDGSFTFTGDVAGSIGGGGQLEEDNLVPGKYTVRERIPDGWELSFIRCDDNNSSGSVATGTATINLDPGETVTCTYTNTYLAKIPGLPRKHPGAVGTPEPASVLACYLDVPVVEAMPGQQFDISVNVCNRGGEKATKSVDLLINGQQEQSQTVGIGPGGCQTVVFRVFKTVPGTYEVSIMGQVGYFTIMPLYPGYVVTQGPAQQGGGIGTAGIVTIVVVLIVLVIGVVLILRR